MENKNFFDELMQSSLMTKIILAAVALIWSVVFVLLFFLTTLVLERPSEALEATAVITTPTIGLSPAAASAGSTVTINGEGWPVDSKVLIYLVGPDAPGYAISSATVDATGHFSTDFIFPSDPRWAGQPTLQVLAQAENGSVSAQALLMVVSTPEPATATPTATATATDTPTIVVQTPTAAVIETPTGTSLPGPAQAIAATNMNVRSGPGVSYPVIGALQSGQTAFINGQSYDQGWWQIKFAGGPNGLGWVSAQYVTAQNTENVPLVQAPSAPPAPTSTPVPAPTSTPVVITDWRGEYYNNTDLSGAPVLVRNDIDVNFNWGAGSPAANVPTDNFSARWTRSLYFDGATYRFHASVDDGVRLWVDDRLVIDAWYDGAVREVTGDISLGSGVHNLRIEYYEHSGSALIHVWGERLYSTTPPDADFDADPRSGNVPLKVEFDNDSDGNYNRCEWDFGDDHDSDDCDPRHTYKEAGKYTVRLKIWGPDGSDSKKREDYITVRPVAQFTANQTSGPWPLTVSFTDQSTKHKISEWDFGDGTTSAENNPSHTYTSAGVYTVRLRVKETGVWSDYRTKTNYIVVTEPLPIAAFTASPISGTAPLTVQFTDQSFGAITVRLWNFGDGTTSTLPSPVHTYTAAGVYTVTLTISGPGGNATETKANYITVNPPLEPIQAKFIAVPTIGTPPLGVTFTDNSVPVGSITSWLWDFGDGSTSTLQNPTHSYTTPGEYTVSLTVSGPDGSNTVTRPNYIIVAENLPVVKFTATPLNGGAPLTVTFTDNSLPKDSITSWLWDFGDGSTSTEPNPTHTYNAPGTYPVSLIVSGSLGSSSLTRPDLIVVTDGNQPPQVVPTTATPVPPTETPTPSPTSTDTPMPPPTPTPTPEPPTETPTPEPPTLTPEPPTPTPEPPTPTPEPPTPTPEPPTPTPEPPTSTPEPPTPTPTNIPVTLTPAQ
jgi:PKD repeat protein/uncharacterized protein YraI